MAGDPYTGDGTDHYLYRRPIPELGPGVEIVVASMAVNDRIMIGIPTLIGYRVDDYFCYRHGTAVAAAEAWDPLTDPEPVGWIKHTPTGRYRPDGDLTRQITYH